MNQMYWNELNIKNWIFFCGRLKGDLYFKEKKA
jgi:hypothetical protein